MACEESQAVTVALRGVGISAYSCDLQECSGGFPEWHIQDDVAKVMSEHKWGAIIAFPPCTDLAVSGARWFEKKRKDGRQQKSINFLCYLLKVSVKRLRLRILLVLCPQYTGNRIK